MPSTFDLGGAEGFGPVPGARDGVAREAREPAFHHEWEARVFVLNRLLLKAGLYNLDEFRYAIERLPSADHTAASYYERWFVAIEQLLRHRGVLP
jgi:nitrile hydratase